MSQEISPRYLSDDCCTRFSSESREKNTRRALRVSDSWLSSIEIAIGLRKNPTGDHRLRRWGPWRRGRNLCLREGRWRLGLRQLKVRICRCAGFLVELRCARPNRKHLKPALLTSRHEHLLSHRLFAPILLRPFLRFRPFPFSARLFRPFGAVWPARPCVSSQTVSSPYPRSHQRHARYLRRRPWLPSCVGVS